MNNLKKEFKFIWRMHIFLCLFLFLCFFSVFIFVSLDGVNDGLELYPEGLVS